MRYTISKKPLLLHGTSLAAVKHLFEKGYLPPSTQPHIRNQFYFTPVTANFRRSEHAIPLVGRYTLPQAVWSSKFYAEVNSWNMFFIERFGRVPRWFDSAVDGKRNYLEWLAYDKSLRLTRAQAWEVVEDMYSRKGFIVEPKYELFERFKYKRGDDPTTVRFYCPEGLPIDCVRTVQPLGDRERMFLRQIRACALAA